jgi:hypothetical protein
LLSLLAPASWTRLPLIQALNLLLVPLAPLALPTLLAIFLAPARMRAMIPATPMVRRVANTVST